MRLSRPTIVFASVLVVLGLAVAALGFRGAPARKVTLDVDISHLPAVSPGELADWIIQGRRDFAVIDLRGAAEYEKGHVRGAVSCGSCHENRQMGEEHQAGAQFVDLSKKLVLYTATGRETIELPKAVARNPRLSILAGGWAGWQAEVLAPVHGGGGGESEELLLAKKRQEAVRAYFSGERVVPAAAESGRKAIVPARRPGAHPVAAREGC